METKFEFDHVKHYRNLRVQTKTNTHRTPMTVLSKVVQNEDGETHTIFYSVGFCATSEKNFVKKEGVNAAMQNPVHCFKFDGVKSHHNISFEIIRDMFVQHHDEIPYRHRTSLYEYFFE